MANKATNIHHTAISTMLGYRKCPYSTCKKRKGATPKFTARANTLGMKATPPFLSEAEARRSMTDRSTEPKSTLTNTKCTKNVSSKSTFKNPDGTGNAIGGESRRGASGEA
jgi:hypothetical protein